MKAYRDCFVPMCWAGSQAGSMLSSISLEEAVTAASIGPEGKGGWRCLAVERLSRVELRADAWHTEPRTRRQTCIDEVDFDSDAQPEGDPQ